ncbi:EamA family transporter [Filibacter tadaridae]|uniref:Putative 4-amino-4-deoxy-L-arabinose-phosphoundecaprenol flippase subunit ArnF n=1 Tax=Filibacter tadaridae TaxID=2483811 RepID=A0A3P5X6H4_9BACL|nr:EamA family transporter [Filibacter tadaridae]VDC23907.1 putative 4-amino-4-deoxy-L-arabinose-phosphoundecaprenol flippase subunit ArnF [Filibacter tadaridae]
MNPTYLLLILLNTAILVAGQFLWKFGMTKKEHDFGSVFDILKVLFSPYIFTGLIMYGVATVIWLFILTKVQLSVAYPLQSFAYVITLFGAYFIFGEPLTFWKVVGVLFIMLGVSIIGISESAITLN